MPIPLHELARHLLPNLTSENYRISSAPAWEYNCIAWAVGVSDAWWWPSPGRFWPAGVPREETIEAFAAAVGTRGYVPCSSAELELGVEKVAIYAREATPTHAARQLANGWWTSKLGPSFDIEHTTLEAVAGGIYGEPVAILCREAAT